VHVAVHIDAAGLDRVDRDFAQVWPSPAGQLESARYRPVDAELHVDVEARRRQLKI